MGRHFFSSFPRAIVARMSSPLHIYSRSKKGSKDSDVLVNGGSQNEDVRASSEEAHDGPDSDINPGELTFEEGTLLRFLSV